MRRSKILCTQKNFDAFKKKIESDEKWAVQVRVRVKEQSQTIKEMKERIQYLEEKLQDAVEDEQPLFEEMRGLSSDSDDEPVPKEIALGQRKVNPK